MKIVFLSDDFPPASFGGAGISTCELALGMNHAGHDVSIITTCRKQSEAGESEYQCLKVFKIASDYSGRWRAWVSLYNRPVVRKVEELLQKIRPDVVHANNIHFYISYHCLKLAKRYAKTVVWTARDVMAFSYGKLDTQNYLEHLDAHLSWYNNLKQAGKRYNPFRNFCIRRYLGYADRTFAISKSLQEALLQNGIKNVGMIYNGIDARGWQVNKDTVTRFRAKHGLENKKVLLFSGRLSSSKGGASAVEALKLIIKEVPNTVLLVAGTIDEYARAMQNFARGLGVEKNLQFTDWIVEEDIRAAYAISNVVLMPSIYLDAFGRVNIEAMTSRKPVVGTCYGGTPEIVENGVTGYIVDPRHTEEIAEKTLELLKDPQKAERFGQAGYERVKNLFDIDKIVVQTLSHYSALLNKH